MSEAEVVKEYQQSLKNKPFKQVHNQYKLKNKWCSIRPVECTCNSFNNNCLENGKK